MLVVVFFSESVWHELREGGGGRGRALYPEMGEGGELREGGGGEALYPEMGEGGELREGGRGREGPLS